MPCEHAATTSGHAGMIFAMCCSQNRSTCRAHSWASTQTRWASRLHASMYCSAGVTFRLLLSGLLEKQQKSCCAFSIRLSSACLTSRAPASSCQGRPAAVPVNQACCWMFWTKTASLTIVQELVVREGQSQLCDAGPSHIQDGKASKAVSCLRLGRQWQLPCNHFCSCGSCTRHSLAFSALRTDKGTHLPW